jgi:hypothetical protein
MDAESMCGLESRLDEYLDQFADYFSRRDTWAHLPVYVGGQSRAQIGNSRCESLVSKLSGVGKPRRKQVLQTTPGKSDKSNFSRLAHREYPLGPASLKTMGPVAGRGLEPLTCGL